MPTVGALTLISLCALQAPSRQAPRFSLSRLPPLPPLCEVGLPPFQGNDLTIQQFSPLRSPSSDGEREALLRSQAHETWYGWQTLAVDATAVGILLLGAAIVTTRPPTPEMDRGPRPLAFELTSIALYVVGPPVVHIAHHHVLQGLGSFGVRALVPLAGFAIGYFGAGALGSGRGDSMTIGAVGAVIGAVGSATADAATLAWDRWYFRDTKVFIAGSSF
jgi:hypothetical protein